MVPQSGLVESTYDSLNRPGSSWSVGAHFSLSLILPSPILERKGKQRGSKGRQAGLLSRTWKRSLLQRSRAIILAACTTGFALEKVPL
ncbi:hypothetical protein P3S67_024384 [Capsicum chacoense]